MPNVYQDAVVTKYNIFNSLFLSLPFHDIFRTGTLLPLLVQASEEGFEAGNSPQQIIESFFEEYTEHATEHERRDMLFNFIKFIERQVVLFDSVEDAGFDQTHDLNGPGSITQLLNRVDSDDLREKLLKKLDDFCVRIVLTAHPTQFYPGKVLGIITDLEEAIKDNDFVTVNNLLLQLGKTGFINKNKPTPFDEALTLGWFLENVFYEAIPAIMKKLLKGLNFPINKWQHTELFRLGFWPGGDRDGNPFVTSDVTLQVADRLRQILLKCYWRDIKYLKRRLTFDGVEDFIATAERKVNNAIYYPEQEHYATAEELLSDLQQAREVLVKHHDSFFVDSLDDTILKIKLFGFFFASLDIRQVSPKHSLAWEEVLTKIEKQVPVFTYTDYQSWDEKRKIDFLLSLQVELTETDFHDPITQDIYGSMLAIREIQRRNGESGAHRYVISNCASALNVVEVLALMKNVWKTTEIGVDIVPLFETVDDLAGAADVMKQLFENKYYREHLARRGNQQTIMVGFSDGTKDGGYLRANWSIFTAKEQLTKISREYDVKVTFFDGRGGPPGRGGGNNHAFYASLGKDIEDKEIQLTVQGQTISSNYGTVPTAMYNLERLFTAGLENHLFMAKNTKDQLSDADKALMEELANVAYEAYLGLKNHKTFVPYLEKITPLRFYGQTKIGSRPDKRGSGGGLKFEDLRAIPFVGSWAQMKQNVPGFYGFGSALETLKKNGKMDALKKLYKRSLFVRTLVENSMQSLMKAYYPATKYLKENPEFSTLWNMMFEEYERSINLMLEFSGEKELMNQNPVTKESIIVRERIVLPLMTIQQYALQKLQSADLPAAEVDVYSKLVMRAMFGIINAARNSA
ncbi:phosphoenolpyruvate carboxylase [Runella sp. CRIBMP]|uniref:Phosphoenolpyruvate carboxylase n=1 Tax=Runella aurantiaca TaxID=2282308 RepID=A0A369I9E1_9BACT|nr:MULTISPECIES: phosphoenolpyruvate carboxylase [Runella]NBB19731.1 phosphoenolpyruvate carboxylase [Runella sp. CRIBMP]RDB03784.1 phosphoenolpyruvate carboxylase [Runella aurantiaca]